MQDLSDIRKKIGGMADISLKMLQITFAAFMEHDRDLVSAALEEEKELNGLEKQISASLVELSQNQKLPKKSLKTAVAIYLNAAGDLELIGDYCKDILERVQIKIEERLLFSDEAVKEYAELYHKAESALKDAVEALKNDYFKASKKILEEEKAFKDLLEECRNRHNQRLIKGVCSPMACNMFLNMLDFTSQIFYRSKAIVKSLLKLK